MKLEYSSKGMPTTATRAESRDVNGEFARLACMVLISNSLAGRHIHHRSRVTGGVKEFAKVVLRDHQRSGIDQWVALQGIPILAGEDGSMIVPFVGDAVVIQISVNCHGFLSLGFC
jgi:hypothetical protein